MVSTLEPVKCSPGFKPLLASGSTRVTYAAATQQYWRCPQCAATFLDPAHRLSLEAEKARWGCTGWKPVDPQLESAWFQPLHLSSEILVSSLCFQMHLVPLQRGTRSTRTTSWMSDIGGFSPSSPTRCCSASPAVRCRRRRRIAASTTVAARGRRW
jgi:hypothetical protein